MYKPLPSLSCGKWKPGLRIRLHITRIRMWSSWIKQIRFGGNTIYIKTSSNKNIDLEIFWIIVICPKTDPDLYPSFRNLRFNQIAGSSLIRTHSQDKKRKKLFVFKLSLSVFIVTISKDDYPQRKPKWQRKPDRVCSDFRNESNLDCLWVISIYS